MHPTSVLLASSPGFLTGYTKLQLTRIKVFFFVSKSLGFYLHVVNTILAHFQCIDLQLLVCLIFAFLFLTRETFLHWPQSPLGLNFFLQIGNLSSTVAALNFNITQVYKQII